MNILHAWRDSLSLFAPKNFKTFVLVTLKSIIDTYKIMLRYWWWLIIVCIGLVGFNIKVTLAEWTVFYLYLMVYLSARPFVKNKNYDYFGKYTPFFLVLMGVSFIGAPFIMMIAIKYDLTMIAMKHNLIKLIFNITITHQNTYILSYINFFQHALLFGPINWAISGLLLLPLYVFFILFFLDSNKITSIGISFIRAVKMIVYNYPLFLITYVIILLFFRFIHYGTGQLSLHMIPTYDSMIREMIAYLFLPIPICIWTNIYIKKLHEQSSLYFKQPS